MSGTALGENKMVTPKREESYSKLIKLRRVTFFQTVRTLKQCVIKIKECILHIVRGLDDSKMIDSYNL